MCTDNNGDASATNVAHLHINLLKPYDNSKCKLCMPRWRFRSFDKLKPFFFRILFSLNIVRMKIVFLSYILISLLDKIMNMIKIFLSQRL